MTTLSDPDFEANHAPFHQLFCEEARLLDGARPTAQHCVQDIVLPGNFLSCSEV